MPLLLKEPNAMMDVTLDPLVLTEESSSASDGDGAGETVSISQYFLRTPRKIGIAAALLLVASVFIGCSAFRSASQRSTSMSSLAELYSSGPIWQAQPKLVWKFTPEKFGEKETDMPILAVAWLTDQDHVVGCGENGRCYTFSTHKGLKEKEKVFQPDVLYADFGKKKGTLRTVSVLNDATYILVGGDGPGNTTDGQAYIFDWRSGQQVNALTCPNGTFTASDELPNWGMVMTGCSDGFVRENQWINGGELKLPWNARTEAEINETVDAKINTYIASRLTGRQRAQLEAKNMTKEKFLQMVSQLDSKVKAKATFYPDAKKYFHKNTFGRVTSVSYVPSKLRLVSGTSNGKLHYWGSDDGRLIRTIDASSDGPITSLAPSPFHQEVFVGTEDGSITLWNLILGERLWSDKYTYPVKSVALKGGHILVAGFEDGTVRVWDAPTKTKHCTFQTHGGSANSVAVDFLGRIVVGSDDGSVRVYSPCKPEL